MTFTATNLLLNPTLSLLVIKLNSFMQLVVKMSTLRSEL